MGAPSASGRRLRKSTSEMQKLSIVDGSIPLGEIISQDCEAYDDFQLLIWKCSAGDYVGLNTNTGEWYRKRDRRGIQASFEQTENTRRMEQAGITFYQSKRPKEKVWEVASLHFLMATKRWNELRLKDGADTEDL